jgi:hypothetical protein
VIVATIGSPLTSHEHDTPGVNGASFTRGTYTIAL